MARYGTAGGSLSGGHTEYKQTAAAGAKGEVLTAKMLDRLPSAIPVFHDIDIPLRSSDGRLPNVDHAVVIGNTVWLIDSKLWKPGNYRTVLGCTFRGWSRTAHADKKTMGLAASKFSEAIPGVKFKSLIVVHSSRTDQTVNVRWYRPRNAKSMNAAQFEQIISRWMTSTRTPNPSAVNVLMRQTRK